MLVVQNTGGCEDRGNDNESIEDIGFEFIINNEGNRKVIL